MVEDNLKKALNFLEVLQDIKSYSDNKWYLRNAPTYLECAKEAIDNELKKLKKNKKLFDGVMKTIKTKKAIPI